MRIGSPRNCESPPHARSPPPTPHEMAARITAAGVKPELECFEIGHVALATQLWREGLLEDPPFYQVQCDVNRMHVLM